MLPRRKLARSPVELRAQVERELSSLSSDFDLGTCAVLIRRTLCSCDDRKDAHGNS